MNDSSHTAAQSRLNKIEIEIEALTKERDEIKSAIAVLSRYGDKTANDSTPLADKDQGFRPQTPKQATRITTGPPRPDGIPTIWEMTEALLSEASEHCLSTDDLLEKISEKWWPGVVRNQIAPQVYRFAKDGRLKQVDKGVFALPRESTSAEVEKPKAEHGFDMFGPQNPNQSRHGQ